MRFGRLPHDPVALARAPSHRLGTVAPPAVLDRRDIEFFPELYQNNVLPDCTAVGLANGARAVAALNGFGLVVEPTLVPVFYGHCIGDPPDLAATDGAVLLDVLDYQAERGFDVGPQRLIPRSGTVDVTSRTSLASSIDQFGHGYWGVSLRERDMEFHSVWDAEDGRDDGKVVGGHCVFAWDYTGLSDGMTVRVGTWGNWQPATWAWVSARLDEAHSAVYRQLAKTDGTYWSGVLADDMVAALDATQS